MKLGVLFFLDTGGAHLPLLLTWIAAWTKRLHHAYAGGQLLDVSRLKMLFDETIQALSTEPKNFSSSKRVEIKFTIVLRATLLTANVRRDYPCVR